MGKTRVVPHAFNESMVNLIIGTHQDRFLKNTDRVFSGELDSNLPVIFNSLSQITAELACMKYFFANMPVNEVLQWYGKSSLAIANMFRLLGPAGSTVSIEWEGKQRSLPAQAHMDIQNSIAIPFGINTAILSHSQDQLDFLCRLKEDKYTHPAIIVSQFGFEYVKFLQQLAIGDTEDFEKRAEYVRANVAEAYAAKIPDNDLRMATCLAYLSLLDGSTSKLEACIQEMLDKHKKLFDSDRNDMRGSILGLVSLDGLAVLILAYQRGMIIEIDNPYIPKDLLQASLANY